MYIIKFPGIAEKIIFLYRRPTAKNNKCMRIKKLSEKVVNQIAAGEVIESPASAVKELIENALDADATHVEITTSAGGKSFIRVSDNGYGMTPDELSMAVQRHCTSKIFNDLDKIYTFGFRGEALPSIGAIAQLTLISRSAEQDCGAQIIISGGKVSLVQPAATNPGTIVEIKNLFFEVPARLKFLKSEQIEANAIKEVVKRIAISYPNVRFTLSGINRSKLDFLPTPGDLMSRVAQVLGETFYENSIELNKVSKDISLKGYVGIPTFNRANTNQQYLFVNGRPVQDKLLFSAVRASYTETIPKGRYPVVVLLLNIDQTMVDVNVHPAKSDVRFRNPAIVRNFIIDTIRQALIRKGLVTSSTLSTSMLSSFHNKFGKPLLNKELDIKYSPSYPSHLTFQEEQKIFVDYSPPGITPITNAVAQDEIPYPLGIACAQIHQNYIISQTHDRVVIIDQHAAHERILFEKMRKILEKERLTSQKLLIPEIIDFIEEECNLIMAHADHLHKLGLIVERFGAGAIAIRETPTILGKFNASALLRDLLDEIIDDHTTDCLFNKLEQTLATMACHASIKSGRKMQIEEMNALLREMEKTPNSSQCNHGRPTFIELKLRDIEKLFGR
ncbi:DNA mismatch repair protein MutL [Liberibacter crescens BT-1]|uniref:DNA mismatch repair protein MutL n=2 Tax=Liberibacter crescens TaxID=1273132 RepID=L0ETR2_LIBCB|nr:DNA mismatch repair protein MutL [Liberibacter crescens BT-1]